MNEPIKEYCKRVALKLVPSGSRPFVTSLRSSIAEILEHEISLALGIAVKVESDERKYFLDLLSAFQSYMDWIEGEGNLTEIKERFEHLRQAYVLYKDSQDARCKAITSSLSTTYTLSTTYNGEVRQ